jgi:DNA repair protein RecO (recombination protein O)
MNIYESEAIVLSTTDYGESDRLITFFTRSSGKVKGIAKGARRSQKRFVHAFEPFSLVAVHYHVSRSSSLLWVDACKLLNPHLELREDLQRWGYAALVCEVVKEMAPESEQQENLFGLLRESLVRLGEDKDAVNVVVITLFRLLSDLGYVLDLRACRKCHQPLGAVREWWLDLVRGELLCSRHAPLMKGFLPADLGTLLLLEQVRLVPHEQLWRLRLRQEMKLPLLQAVIALARHLLGKDLKSLKVLQQVNAL